ncbi:MAG: sugar transferase [Bryobacteraceae bacterium]|nr:sugar transferase [Bryobacteraceae bacterium]
MASMHLLERVAAGVLLLASAPLLAAAAIAIRVLSRRSPLVAHRRVGWLGEPFWMLKLRTMWPSTPPATRSRALVERVSTAPPPDGKRRFDPRVTCRFAAWCRTYSIDELPQLWHVARGQMSLVGPRPLTQAEIDRYYAGIAAEVLQLRPGMTGLWQVLGRNELTYRRRRRLDLFLVRRYSLRLYWWILARTPPRVLSGSGAW